MRFSETERPPRGRRHSGQRNLEHHVTAGSADGLNIRERIGTGGAKAALGSLLLSADHSTRGKRKDSAENDSDGKAPIYFACEKWHVCNSFRSVEVLVSNQVALQCV